MITVRTTDDAGDGTADEDDTGFRGTVVMRLTIISNSFLCFASKIVGGSASFFPTSPLLLVERRGRVVVALLPSSSSSS